MRGGLVHGLLQAGEVAYVGLPAPGDRFASQCPGLGRGSLEAEVEQCKVSAALAHSLAQLKVKRRQR